MINHLVTYLLILTSLSLSPTINQKPDSTPELPSDNPASHALAFLSEAFHTNIRKESTKTVAKSEKQAVHRSFAIKQMGRNLADDLNSTSQTKGAVSLGDSGNHIKIPFGDRSVRTDIDNTALLTQEITLELNSAKERIQSDVEQEKPQEETKFIIEDKDNTPNTGKTYKSQESETEIKPKSGNNVAKNGGKSKTQKGFVRVRIKDGRITGNTSQKLYKIEGGVEVFYDDMTINAENADMNQKTEQVDLNGEVSVVDNEFNLKADQLHVDFKNKEMQAEKFVQFGNNKENTEKLRDDMTRREKMTTSFKNKLSKVFCSSLNYRWESGNFDAKGQVKITQEGLVASCESLSFDKTKKSYTLNENVFVEMSDFNWLFTNKIVEEPDRKMTEVIGKQPANITAKTMIVNDEDHTITLIGDATTPAKIFQKDKYILAPSIIIDEDKKSIFADQNTSIFQENADWLIEGGRIKPDDQDPETLKMLKNPLEIKGTSLKYYYEKKELELTNNVSIIGTNRKATCDKLTYNDVDSVLVLSGNVVFFNGQKEKLQAQMININTRERSFALTGITNGFFAIDKDKSGKPELTDTPGQTGTVDVGKDEKPKTSDDRPNIED